MTVDLNIYSEIMMQQFDGNNRICQPLLHDVKRAEKYVNLINRDIIPAIQTIVKVAFDNVWFQQNGVQVDFTALVEDKPQRVHQGHSI